MRLVGMLVIILLFCFIGFVQSVISAEVKITGKVINTKGMPIDSLIIHLMSHNYSTLTNTQGFFTLTDTFEIGIKNLSVAKYQELSSIHYSSNNSLLSFSVNRNQLPVSITLFSPKGQTIPCSFNKVLAKGRYTINPFSLTRQRLCPSIYGIRLITSNQVYQIKALYLPHTQEGNSLAYSYSLNNKPLANYQSQPPAIDTLKLYKYGYNEVKIPIDTLFTDLGTITTSWNPVFYLEKPNPGQKVEFGDSVFISPNVFDPDGKIHSVSYYIDGELLATHTAKPYSIYWKSFRHTLGNRHLTAIAQDQDGKTYSDSLIFKVVSTRVRQFTYKKINTFHHDSLAFTQGLVYENGRLYESAGKYGMSSLRHVALETGVVLKIHSLDDAYFAEGMTLVGDKIVQITWREYTGFVYEKASFTVLDTFTYTRSGWGLTDNGEHLIMSDGSANLYLWNRDFSLAVDTIQEYDTINVTENNQPLSQINELEFFYHNVFANIWHTYFIAIINLETGKVIGKVDCSDILGTNSEQRKYQDVFNGIAYDKDNDRIFVTGKFWPKLFEIKLITVD